MPPTFRSLLWWNSSEFCWGIGAALTVFLAYDTDAPLLYFHAAIFTALFMWRMRFRCTSYELRVDGIVTTATGDPIPLTLLIFKPEHAVETTFPTSTGGDGRFKGRVHVGREEFATNELPVWSLEARKTGYAPTTIVVSPERKPTSWMTPVRISVGVRIETCVAETPKSAAREHDVVLQ